MFFFKFFEVRRSPLLPFGAGPVLTQLSDESNFKNPLSNSPKTYIELVVEFGKEQDQVARVLFTQECVGVRDECGHLVQQEVDGKIADGSAKELAQSRVVVLRIIQYDGLNI